MTNRLVKGERGMTKTETAIEMCIVCGKPAVRVLQQSNNCVILEQRSLGKEKVDGS